MLVLVCLASWAMPGAGHLWLGRRQKGLVFLLALAVMFLIGLLLQGRIFSFDLSEPLVALAAVADIGCGLPWIVARVVGAGGGTVTAATYEVRQLLPHRLGAAQFARRAGRVRYRDGSEVTSHFVLLSVFAFLVSLVFAVLMRDEPSTQLRTGALMFGGFLVAAVVIGWLMYPLPL